MKIFVGCTAISVEGPRIQKYRLIDIRREFQLTYPDLASRWVLQPLYNLLLKFAFFGPLEPTRTGYEDIFTKPKAGQGHTFAFGSCVISSILIYRT